MDNSDRALNDRGIFSPIHNGAFGLTYLLRRAIESPTARVRILQNDQWSSPSTVHGYDATSVTTSTVVDGKLAWRTYLLQQVECIEWLE